MQEAVVLLSGGLDSAVNAALCKERDKPRLALTFLYGQRAARNEAQSAAWIAKHLAIDHRVIELPWLGQLAGGALIHRQREVPQPQLRDLDDRDVSSRSAAQVWVPNRNGVFINIAAAFAEEMGCSQVVAGFNEEEAATFPDNSLPFVEATNAALGFSTRNRVKVKSYTQTMRKREIYREFLRCGLEEKWIWSCYEGGDSPCGTCESCMRFERGRRCALEN